MLNNVIEKIELGNAHVFQLLSAGMTVCVSVEIRDQGYADYNALRSDEGNQSLQIRQHLTVTLAGVTLVDVRVCVLTVDVEYIDTLCGKLHILPGDV